jgi:hypothetical protein
MTDLIAIAAFPKSGITYLSSLLFHSLFPQSIDAARMGECIVDVHEYPSFDGAHRVNGLTYIKTHFSFDGNQELSNRTTKAIYLIRDPIDVARSAYDFKHLVDANFNEGQTSFMDRWIATAGGEFPFAGTWKHHMASWMTQSSVPMLVVRYTALVDDPRDELVRIFRFLDVNPDHSRVVTAISQSSMPVMRARQEYEFLNKIEGQFYRPIRELTMSRGARFINKGHRRSMEELSPSQQEAAMRQFYEVTAYDRLDGEANIEFLRHQRDTGAERRARRA